MPLSCCAFPNQSGGRSPTARDDLGAHQHLAAGWTPLRERVPVLRTHHLPVQRHGDLHGQLPERCTADGQRLSMRVMVQPIAPHRPRLGHGHMEEKALEKVRNR